MKGLKLFICCTFIFNCLAAEDHLFGVPGKCPELQFAKDFEPKKVVGKWYSVYDNQKQQPCTCYEFVEATPNHFHAYLHHINATIFLDQKNPDNVAEGYVVSAKFIPSIDKSVLFAFDIDYENYAGVYRCKEVGDVHYPYFGFWSRSYTMSEEKVEHLKDILRKYEGIDVSQLRAVEQNNCPY